MTARTRSRIAVTGGAAALCVGIAVPAAACVTGSGADAARGHTIAERKTITLADAKAWAAKLLTHRADWLSRLRDKVGQDPRLTADQRTAFAARIDRALDSIAAAKAAVHAADSKAQVRDALAEAHVLLPRFPHPVHTAPTLAQAKSHAMGFLAHEADVLRALRTKIAGSSRLTQAQQDAATARIDSALAAIAKARSAVQAANSIDAVRAAVHVDAARLHLPRVHHLEDRPNARTVDVKDVRLAPPHRSLVVSRMRHHHDWYFGDYRGRHRAGPGDPRYGRTGSADHRGRHCHGDHHGDGDGFRG